MGEKAHPVTPASTANKSIYNLLRRYRELMEINFREWLSDMYEHVQTHPRRAVLYFVYSLYLSVWYPITSRRPFGTNIYEADWDLLIVLDACRVDTLREVADEYESINEVNSIWSVGSTSPEWIANTFRKDWLEDIGETTYISANGYSDAVLAKYRYPPANNTPPIDFSSWSVVDEMALRSHVPLWKEKHDDKFQSVLPQTVTDHVIEHARSQEDGRILAHYIQPHLPYLGYAYRDDREMTAVEENGYQLLEKGQASRDDVYDAYRETLRMVLDEIEVLLQNVDAEKVVITADHGEAFGEWAAYGHPEGFPHPVVRKVPWIEVSATDEGTREPTIEVEDDTRVDIEEHLRDLGYR